jgi:dipeptide transport system ATP-binding protein
MTPLLEARGLARDYKARRGLFAPPATVKALAGVSFSLEAGRTLAVVGESGCGKSTLARLLTFIEPPTAGALIVEGVDVAQADGTTRKRLRREIQIVFQNPYGSLNPRQRIGKALEEPLLVNTSHASARHPRATSWCGSDCGRNSIRATPTCFRAASASASRSPEP